MAVSIVGEDGGEDTRNHLLAASPVPHGMAQENSMSVESTSWQGADLSEDPIWERVFDVYDSFLVAISLVLLVKTSLCVYAYSVDKVNSAQYLDAVSPLTTNLIRFNEQLITAFTIVFVTIMTTVTRRYALYKAQKGAYISDLEQLQASISLPSTIKMVFSLQQFTKISVLLVLLWSFYYTGSQASKREYTLVFGHADTKLTAAYPRSTAAYVNFDTSTWPAGSDDSLVLEFKGGKTDERLRVKGIDRDENMLLPIPHPGRYSGFFGLALNGSVNHTEISGFRPSNTDYSRVGRPLLIAKNQTYYSDSNSDKLTTSPDRDWSMSRVKGDFQILTSYIQLDCLSMELLPASQFPSGVASTLSQAINITDAPGSAISSAKQLQFWQRWNLNETFQGGPAPRINGSQPATLKFTCDLLEPRIKVYVRCSDTACLASRLEFPRDDPSVFKSTIFSNSTFTKQFFDTMLLAEGIPKARNETGNIANWLLPTLQVEDYEMLANGTMTPERFQDFLLGQNTWLEDVINAYVNIIIKSNYPSWTEVYSSEYYGTPSPPPDFDVFDFRGSIWDPHYQIYWEWIVIDYLAGAVLLAASIFSFWLRKKTLAPDIFGFVSSLTRDNPHFPVPVGGSTLDGISRTRALRSMKVKIADISGSQEGRGRLGFVPILPVLPAETLKKDRKYL